MKHGNTHPFRVYRGSSRQRANNAAFTLFSFFFQYNDASGIKITVMGFSDSFLSRGIVNRSIASHDPRFWHFLPPNSTQGHSTQLSKVDAIAPPGLSHML